MTICLGKTEKGKPLHMDIDILLRTRLLIQANSGGGKSWLLRRLAEQLFGKIPVILIDPEGEFATLREKFGYVLVGKGGETPADPRSAGLVAQRLLELRASAVCDLYEMKPADRHRWVRLFLEALIDAPKKLWRPTVIMVDEAHTFCPEKAAGESEASDAMTGLPTRGRKRRFCAIWATQRLGKLRKDASAELLNRLVGPTFEDIDLKRAADLLSIRTEDRRKFDQQMRVLEPGHFFALGRAIAKERVLVRVGPVATSHEIEEAKYGTEPPPPPGKVKALLPKLQDLPKEAEEKARTVAEFRAEIAQLKRDLVAAKHTPANPPRVVQPKLEVKIVKGISKGDIKRLESLIERAAKVEKSLSWLGVAIGAEGSRLSSAVASAKALDSKPLSIPTRPLPKPTPPLPKHEIRAKFEPASNDLTGPEQRILNAVAWIESLGQPDADQAAAASLAGYTVGGGAWNNPRGKLHTKGLLVYRSGRIGLTDAGRAIAVVPEAPLTTEELHEKVMQRLGGPERKILRVLLDAYPAGISNDDLATRAGYEPKGGAFNNPRGRLRSLGLIEYPEKGMVAARAILFLE